MARFCKNCGAQLGDGAGFCVACGTKVEEQSETAPPPAYQPPPEAEYQTPPPGYGQPGQPGYAPPQAPAYGAPPKKKILSKPLLIIIIIAAVIVALVLIVPLAAGGAMSSQAEKDFFKIGSDQVPSVKLVLGEKRDVIGVSSSTSNGVQEMVVEYKVDENQNKEMDKYSKALMDKYGYINTSPYDFTGPKGSDFQFAKVSEEEGYIVIVKIDYDSKGYTLTLKRGKGTLTVNEDPEPAEPEPAEPAEPDEPDEPAVPAEDMVEIIVDPVFLLMGYDSKAEAIAAFKGQGIEVSKNSDGSYTFKMTKALAQKKRDEGKETAVSLLDPMKNEGYVPGVLDVEYNQDLSLIKILCNNTLVENEDNFTFVRNVCSIIGPIYQVYDGKGLNAKTVIVFHNSDTGAELELVSPDWFYE